MDGDLTWEQCVAEFETENEVTYPYAFLRNQYMAQMKLFEERFSRRIPDIERPQGHLDHYQTFLRSDVSNKNNKLTFD